MKQNLGHTIRLKRESLKLTQTDIGDYIGVDKGTVSRYEKGDIAPDFDRMPALATILRTSVWELFAFAETGNIENGPNVKGTVPLISWVQAGHWHDAIENLQPGEGERIATTWRARKHTCALRVRGDSMEPKFPDGCIIIVEPEEDARPGAFVIVRQNGGEATFKQLIKDGAQIFLKPLNSRYPIMNLLSDATICGVVKRIEMDV